VATETEPFFEQARRLLAQMLSESPKADRDELLDAYAEALTKLHSSAAHELLDEVIRDAHTRIDARLSPDPVRQTIATIQTGMQDVWRSLWK
jgi:acetyl-CoA carboxylase carboxyltransferase component